MMESTTRERQEALRTEIFQRMADEKRHNTRVYILLGLLAVLATAVQVGSYLSNHLEVFHP
jgi:hypothetical protein